MTAQPGGPKGTIFAWKIFKAETNFILSLTGLALDATRTTAVCIDMGTNPLESSAPAQNVIQLFEVHPCNSWSSYCRANSAPLTVLTVHEPPPPPLMMRREDGHF